MMLEQMSSELRLPVDFIVNIANGASYEYKFYEIPKKNGGVRRIYHPSRRLKALQRWILQYVVENFPIHNCAMAYRKDVSTFANASRHVNSAYLLRLDFVDFFESITIEDLRRYVEERQHHFENWTGQDFEVFFQIVCRNDVLTIGSPTSPSLSNALCFDLDQRLDSYCRTREISYTRYADDLFFSARRPGVLQQLENVTAGICADLRFPTRLRLNPGKTRHASKRGARRVTGLILGSDEKVYVGRKVKRKIRAQIHRFDLLNVEERASLAGLIAYVVGHDPAFINSLINKYGLARVRQAQQKSLLSSRS